MNTITQIGSMQWISKLYRTATSGVDLERLRRVGVDNSETEQRVGDLVFENNAVKVTISSEARAMYDALLLKGVK